MNIDPRTYLWMHEQEIQRTMRDNALAKSLKESQAKREGYPASPFRANRIRTGLHSLQRVLRPSGTGSA